MTTAIDKKHPTLAMLDQAMPMIAKIIPRNMNPERFAKLLQLTLKRDSKLRDCKPLTVINGFAGAAQLGLEISGPTGMAYLVPFKGEAVLILGYRGLLHLAQLNGKVVSIRARVVYANDEFDFDEGLTPFLKHKPVAPEGRGGVVGAYAVAEFENRAIPPRFEWMWASEIETVRSRAPSSNSSPWKDWYEEMAKKTAARRLCKWLDLEPQAQRAIAEDEAVEAGHTQTWDMVDVAPEPNSAAALPKNISELAAQQAGTDPPAKPATKRKAKTENEKVLQELGSERVLQDAANQKARLATIMRLRNQITTAYKALSPDRRTDYRKHAGLPLEALTTIDNETDVARLQSLWDQVQGA